MIKNTLAVAMVATCTLLVEASAALAGDPSQVGKHVEDIVSPNVKSFWKIGVLIAAVALIVTRPRGAMIAAVLLCAVLSGAIIYNPNGLADTVSSIGHKVL